MQIKKYLFIFTFILLGLPQHSYAALSKAEGVDRSKAAYAQKWVGTIIGINDGEKSFVITEGTALDHIKKYAQRSVRIDGGAHLFKDGESAQFADFAIGDRVTVQGNYNAAKRIITASTITVGVTRGASVPEKITAASSNGLSRNLSLGSRGGDVTWLQNYLIQKAFLKVPSGTKLGYFGAATKTAVQKYQKSIGLPPVGVVGPQTRAALGNG